MRFLILLLVFFVSCSEKSPIEQVDYDLKAMLENKVEIRELVIIKVVPISDNGRKYDEVTFDCKLHFTHDLFADDFKFSKGMNVIASENVFTYEKAPNGKLVKVKFGNIDRIE